MRRSPVATVAIVALLLTSMVALPLGTGLAIAQGPPDHSGAPEHAGPPDHAGVPTDNIKVDRRGSSAGGPPEDVSAWGVSASRHSETLGVEVRLVDGELSELVLDDDVNHAGREVAVDATALVAALPEVETVDDLPDRVYGEHETEGRWSRPLVVEDGYAMLEVPHFSTNTITFESTFTINSDPAPSGAQFDYEIGATEEIGEVDLSVTGRTNSEWQNVTALGLGDGDTISTTVNGSTAPSGPNGSPAVTFTSKGKFTGAAEIDGTIQFYNRSGPYYDTGVNIDSGSSISKPVDIDYDGYYEVVVAGGSSNDLLILDENGENTDTGRTAYLVYGIGNVTGDSTPEIIYKDSNGDVDYYDLNALSSSKIQIYQAGEPLNYNKSRPGMEIPAVYQNDLFLMDAEGNKLETIADRNDLLYGGPTGDFDGDGDPEFVIGNDNYNAIMLDTDGSYIGKIYKSSGSNIRYDEYGKSVGDIDNDGKEEFAFSDSGDALAYQDATGEITTLTSPTVEYGIGGIAIDPTTDPAIDLDGDGVADAEINGDLSFGNSSSKSVTIPTGSQSWTVTSETGSFDVEVAIKERTETIDPSVTITSESGSQTLGGASIGVLGDGVTEDLSAGVDETLIDGNVSVSVSASESVSGPSGAVALNYSHASTETRVVDYNGTSFKETYSVSRTFEESHEGVDLRIPFSSEYVVGIEDVTATYEVPDGGETVTEPSYDWDESRGELVASLGNVDAGTTVTISAVGEKVRVTSGEITVVEPSSQFEDLDTRIRLDSTGPDGNVVVETTNLRQVSGIGRLAYVSSTSWTGGVDQSPTHLDNGKQFLRFVNPVVGGFATLTSSHLGFEALTGDANIKVIDMSEPRFRIEEGDKAGGVVEVTEFDTLDGTRYELYRVSDATVSDTSVAEETVSLRTGDKEGVYTIRVSERPALAIGSASSSSSSGFGGIPEWLLLLIGVTLSLGFLIRSSSRVDAGSFRPRSGSTIALGVGTLAIVFVAVEILTPYSLVGSVTERGLRILGESTRGLTGALSAVFIEPLLGTFGALVATIGVVLGVIALEQRTRLSVPLPVTIGVSGLAVVWLFESIAPGSVLGPLTSGLSEVGAAVWILGILSAVGVIYLWLRSRRPEIVIGGSS